MPNNDSQRSKRRKLSDTGVISEESRSAEKADRVSRDKIQITHNTSLGAMMQNDSISAAHSETQNAEIADPTPIRPQVSSYFLSGDIVKERDANAPWTTLVSDVQSDLEERVLDSETESASRESFE